MVDAAAVKVRNVPFSDLIQILTSNKLLFYYKLYLIFISMYLC